MKASGGAILKRAGTEDRNQKTEYIENHWIKNENTTKKITKYEMDKSDEILIQRFYMLLINSSFIDGSFSFVG